MHQSPKMIGVASGKGGVGKSTLTVSLAKYFQQKGYQTGILDGDIYGPSIRHLLPEEEMPRQGAQQKIVPAIAKGLHYISVDFFKEAFESFALRAPIVNDAVQQLMQQVDWSFLDYIFVDFPPGSGDIPISLLQQGDFLGMIIVTTPQEIALIDVEKNLEIFLAQEQTIFGIVENMSFFEAETRVYPFGKGGGGKLAQQYQVPLLGQVPLDPAIAQAVDRREIVFEIFPESQGSLTLQAIGNDVLDKAEAEKKKLSDCLDEFELLWDKHVKNQSNMAGQST